ncbi:sulfotransferase [Elysia marginata]|uniref:Sulfotransferase n=1 Tax=Elysia marginata TaxID=1093978 RepID=A0AAV4G3R2_9GAST|nr:sulfotransferase [Elysia marginata]
MRVTYKLFASPGDGSVSTLWSNDDWWKNPENCGLLEPRYTNAHHVHRLYSDFLYFQKQDKAREHFHRASVQAIDALEECKNISGFRPCIYNYTIASKSRARLRLGLYSVYLQEWLSVFSRDQLFVIRLEDYSLEPLKTISRVYKFLGLKSLSEEVAEDVLEKPRANPRRAKDKKMGKMLPETRALLTSYYHEYNVQLAKLLGDKRFLWDDVDV